MPDDIILVNAQDEQIGTGEKMPVHEQGLLHRAFSVLIFNSNGELLLQQRAKSKYHCGGLWTNTVCSHPRSGESILEAAHRRLQEEMGFNCVLRETDKFTYRAEFDNGLIEHEIDHVVTGLFDGNPEINPDEADAYRWISLPDLRHDMKTSPEKYTPWFIKIIGERLFIR